LFFLQRHFAADQKTFDRDGTFKLKRDALPSIFDHGNSGRMSSRLNCEVQDIEVFDTSVADHSYASFGER
jgi:hypothetical protein